MDGRWWWWWWWSCSFLSLVSWFSSWGGFFKLASLECWQGNMDAKNKDEEHATSVNKWRTKKKVKWIERGGLGYTPWFFSCRKASFFSTKNCSRVFHDSTWIAACGLWFCWMPRVSKRVELTRCWHKDAKKNKNIHIDLSISDLIVLRPGSFMLAKYLDNKKDEQLDLWRTQCVCLFSRTFRTWAEFIWVKKEPLVFRVDEILLSYDKDYNYHKPW